MCMYWVSVVGKSDPMYMCVLLYIRVSLCDVYVLGTWCRKE